jgi:hypothetical protein
MGIASAGFRFGTMYGRRVIFSDEGETRQDIDWELGCLSSQMGTQSTDPKDKIYGLAGIIARWRNGHLTVD